MIGIKKKTKHTTEKKEQRKSEMANIFRIYKGDLKSIFKNPVALIVILGLLILPSLYAWVNIIACWDPYKNTNGIQVAVVNNDETVNFKGHKINAGDEVIKKLKGNDAIGWDFVSEKEAEYGLTHDRYYAMLEIPKGFTSELLNVMEKDYKKPHILYRVNEKSNAIAPKITDTGAKTVTNEVIHAIVEVVDQVVFQVGNTVGQDMNTEENKIKMMRDLIIAVNDNFGEIEEGLDKADKGLVTVQELLKDANDTMPLIQDGIYEIQDFSSQSRIILEDLEQARYDGEDYISAKFAEFQKIIADVRSLLNEAQANADDAEIILQKIPPMLDKAEQLNKELGEMIKLLESMDIEDPNYDKWIGTIQQLQQETQKLIDILKPIQGQTAEIKEALLTVYDGTIPVLQTQQKALDKQSVRLEKKIEQTQDEEKRDKLIQEKKAVDDASVKLETQINEMTAQKEKLEKMDPEEAAAQVGQMIGQLEQAQKVLGEVEGILTELKDKGVNVDGILTELKKANANVDEAIRVARNFTETLEKAFTISGEIFTEANKILNDMDQAILDLTRVYEDKWSGVLNSIFDDLYKALSDLDAILGKADGALPKVNELLALGMEAGDKGEELLTKLNVILPEAKQDIHRISLVMKKMDDEKLDQLINLLINDVDSSADYFSGPVELKEERLYHIDNYGSAMSPFYTVLAFWVGCLLLSAILTTEAKRRKEDDPEYTAMEEYFGKMLTFVTLGLGQAIIVALGDKFLLGITVTNMAVFIGFSLLIAFVFISIVYTLVSVMGNVGKAICVIFLVLQIAGAGGTFPVEVMPRFYQIIQPYMPFTYAIGAMREAIFGPVAENLFFDFWHLIIYTGISLVVGIIFKKPLYPLIEWFNGKFKESGLGE